MCRAHSLRHKTVAKLFCVYTNVDMQAALFFPGLVGTLLWVCACDQRDGVEPMIQQHSKSAP